MTDDSALGALQATLPLLALLGLLALGLASWALHRAEVLQAELRRQQAELQRQQAELEQLRRLLSAPAQLAGDQAQLTGDQAPRPHWRAAPHGAAHHPTSGPSAQTPSPAARQPALQTPAPQQPALQTPALQAPQHQTPVGRAPIRPTPQAESAPRLNLMAPEFSRARISVIGGGLVILGLAMALRAMGLPSWTSLISAFAFAALLLLVSRSAPSPVGGALRGLSYAVAALSFGALHPVIGSVATISGLIVGSALMALRQRHHPLLGVLAASGAAVSTWMLTDNLGAGSPLAALFASLIAAAWLWRASDGENSSATDTAKLAAALNTALLALIPLGVAVSLLSHPEVWSDWQTPERSAAWTLMMTAQLALLPALWKPASGALSARTGGGRAALSLAVLSPLGLSVLTPVTAVMALPALLGAGALGLLSWQLRRDRGATDQSDTNHESGEFDPRRAVHGGLSAGLGAIGARVATELTGSAPLPLAGVASGLIVAARAAQARSTEAVASAALGLILASATFDRLNGADLLPAALCAAAALGLSLQARHAVLGQVAAVCLGVMAASSNELLLLSPLVTLTLWRAPMSPAGRRSLQLAVASIGVIGGLSAAINQSLPQAANLGLLTLGALSTLAALALTRREASPVRTRVTYRVSGPLEARVTERLSERVWSPPALQRPLEIASLITLGAIIGGFSDGLPSARLSLTLCGLSLAAAALAPGLHALRLRQAGSRLALGLGSVSAGLALMVSAMAEQGAGWVSLSVLALSLSWALLHTPTGRALWTRGPWGSLPAMPARAQRAWVIALSGLALSLTLGLALGLPADQQGPTALLGSAWMLGVGLMVALGAWRWGGLGQGGARALWDQGVIIGAVAGLKAATVDASGWSAPAVASGLSVVTVGSALLILALRAPRPEADHPGDDQAEPDPGARAPESVPVLPGVSLLERTVLSPAHRT